MGFEIVKIEMVDGGRFIYRVKYNGLFKVQVRDLTEDEIFKVEKEAAERLAEELERQIRQRRLRGFNF